MQIVVLNLKLNSFGAEFKIVICEKLQNYSLSEKKTIKYRNSCILPDTSMKRHIYKANCEVPDQMPPGKAVADLGLYVLQFRLQETLALKELKEQIYKW